MPPLGCKLSWGAEMAAETLNLHWQRGDRSVSWSCNGRKVVRRYDTAIRSVAVLGSPPFVVLVEPWELSGPRNAVVFEADGSERLRLIPPQVEYPLGFDQVFASSAGVEAVFSGRFRDVHGEPDFQSGIIHNVREWR